MKAAMGTVLYKESFKFYKDFSKSLNEQDCDEFDVLLLNDDLNEHQSEAVVSSMERNAKLLQGIQNSTPSELRFQLIKLAKENSYDLLILGDFDDTFSCDRVSSTLREYNPSYGFYYNEIYHFDKKRKFFSYMPEFTEKLEDIAEHNYLGLSNVALNLSIIDDELIEKLNVKNAKAFDWYMFSIILRDGHKGKKISGCRTYYRIYENNTAGEHRNTIEDLNKEISVKINHYSLLRKYDRIFEELLSYYIELKSEVVKGKIDLLESADEKDDYWWGQIKSNKLKHGGIQ